MNRSNPKSIFIILLLFLRKRKKKKIKKKRERKNSTTTESNRYCLETRRCKHSKLCTSQLALSTAVGNKVTKTVSTEPAVENNYARAQLHLPVHTSPGLPRTIFADLDLVLKPRWCR